MNVVSGFVNLMTQVKFLADRQVRAAVAASGQVSAESNVQEG